MPTPKSHTLQLSYHNLLYTCHNIIHLPYSQYLIFCLQPLRHTFFAFICSTSLSNILLITELNVIDEIKINVVTNYIDFTKYLINNFIHKKKRTSVPLYKKCYHLKHKYYNQQNPNPLNELKCDFDSKIN